MAHVASNVNRDLVGCGLRKKPKSKSIDVLWVKASFGVRVRKFAAIERAELTKYFLGFVIQYFHNRMAGSTRGASRRKKQSGPSHERWKGRKHQER